MESFDYDITTRTVIDGPATQALNSYDARDADGNVQLRA
jgi:hypothetical protein